MTSPSRPSPRKGLFDTPFWEFTARHELRCQKCTQCETWRYPPAPVCPSCLSEQAAWTVLSGYGTVLAHATFHRTYFKGLPAPYTVVSVETDEGLMLIGNFVEGGVCRIGARVELLFEDVSEDGTTFTLPQWRAMD